MTPMGLQRAQWYVQHRTQIDLDTGCWNWMLMLDVNDYGRCSPAVAGEPLAHRTAYVAWKGEIPAGLQVRHLCHNRKCCNPEHLAAGTQQENIEDSLRDDRKMGSPYGRNGTLSKDLVLFIRRVHNNGESTYKELASLLGVTPMTIYNVVKRRTWKEL
jgi:hypothetical protein